MNTLQIEFSVIICTHNRDSMLKDTLESFSKLESVDGAIECIVVDNASDDDTAGVTEFFAPEFPCPLRYIFEEKLGLSHARNRGISESQGAIIAFVDDDVFFHKSWLRELRVAVGKYQSASAFGGKTIPVFEKEKPQWMTDEFFAYYGSTGTGEEDADMQYPHYPYGVNMAFRKEVFEKVGDFETTLGRIGQNLLSGEELDMFSRLNDADLAVKYISGSIIQHRIPAERITKSWLLDRAFWQGVTYVVFRSRRENCSRFWHSLRAIRACLNALKGRTRALKFTNEEPRYTSAMVASQFCLGAARENLRRSFARTH